MPFPKFAFCITTRPYDNDSGFFRVHVEEPSVTQRGIGFMLNTGEKTFVVSIYFESEGTVSRCCNGGINKYGLKSLNGYDD